MELLEGALKLVGSAVLTTTGVAATVLRTAGEAAGIDIIANIAGTVQDTSFETIRDMWTPDEEKDDEYYEAQAERSERRAESAIREAEQFKKRCEQERKKVEKMQRK